MHKKVCSAVYFTSPLLVSVDDIWKKFVPQPVEIKQGSVYDYYDILEELGR